MDEVLCFMNSIWGRAIRVVLGAALMGLGLVVVGGPSALALGLVGAVALGMGLGKRCLLEAVPHRANRCV